MELNTFFNDPPQIILCQIVGGIDRKKLIKSMKNMTKGVSLTPANITTLSGMIKSPEEVVDEMLESNNFTYTVIGNSAYKNIESELADGGGHSIEYGGFRFHLRHAWDDPLDDMVEKDISSSWYESLCRRGKAAKECPECENENFLDFNDLTCKYCSVDYDMSEKIPDSPIKMYKQVMDYEESSGKVVLKKVA